jgi:hypothetical protein
MLNTKRAYEGAVEVLFSDAAVARIKAKSWFEFELGNACCRCWFGADGDLRFNAPYEEEGKLLNSLIRLVGRLIYKADCRGLDKLDSRKFLAKLMQMEISIEEELMRSPDSQYIFDPSSLRHIDTEKLSDKGRRLVEVLQEQSEIAVTAAEKDSGQKERILLTISKGVVEARMQEKRRRK